MMTAQQLWPIRDNPDFTAGFQRGYAEALLDVNASTDGPFPVAEMLLLMANSLADPVGKAQRRAQALPD